MGRAGAVGREVRAAAALADAAYKRAEGGPGAVARALAASEAPGGLRWDGLQLPRDGLAQPYFLAEERGCPRSLFVALRGTKELSDVLADAGVLMAPLAPGAAGAAGRAAVHRGFLARARGLPLEWLAECARLRGRDLVLCGHSLGGAVAALATVLLLLPERSGPSPAVRCVNFAAPPVGNSALARLVESRGWGGLFRTYLLPEDFVPRSLLLGGGGGRPAGQGGGAGAGAGSASGLGEDAEHEGSPSTALARKRPPWALTPPWTSAAKFISAYRHVGRTLYLPAGGAVCASLAECRGVGAGPGAGEDAAATREGAGRLLEMKFHRMAAYSERVLEASGGVRGTEERAFPGRWWRRLGWPGRRAPFQRPAWEPREAVAFVDLVPGFALWAARGCFPVAPPVGKSPAVPGDPRRHRLVLYLAASGFDRARPEVAVRVGGLSFGPPRVETLGAPPPPGRPSSRPALLEVVVWLPEKVAATFEPLEPAGRTAWQPPPVCIELRNDFHASRIDVRYWHSAPTAPTHRGAAVTPPDPARALLQPAL